LKLPQPPLLLVTDRTQARTPLTGIAAAAFSAGCRWLSIREKDLPPAEQLALAKELLPVARRFGARLTLHGHPSLAREAGLDGVHLPAGGDVHAARRLLGEGALIGISVHAPGETRALQTDYVIAGPAFVTASKPGYGPALGAAGVAAIVAATPVPVVALGGIEADLIPGLLAAGVAGIAVMGLVMRAANPGEVTARLLKALSASSRS
jgi:thiamine-phosphate pyrophosphorylase